jgi:LPXTG-motif cell wall-anchored protein
MKKTNKILIAILTIALLISILPIVSNAASITINNNTPSSNSTTYEVYEILKNTGTDETPVYTLTDNAVKYFITDKNVTATITKDTEKTDKNLTNADEVLEYLTDLATGKSEGVTYTPATKEAFATDYRNKVTADKSDATSTITDLENGYYLIYDVNGDPKSQNMLVNVYGDTSINVKAIGVTLEKQATNGDSHYVGETVEFTIKTLVPNMSGYSSYTFDITDTATNLEILNDTTNPVTVSINGTEITPDGVNVTTSTNSGITTSVLTVNLGSYLLTNKANLTVGSEILVKYKAVLTSGAITTSMATNSAKITYSNNPNTSDTGTVSNGDNPERVYTYTVTVNKKSTLGKDLTGAKFVLKDSNGKYIKVDSTTKAISLIEATDDTVPTDATEFEGGTFKIEGLKEGTYELVETQAPDQYSIVSGLTFTIANNDYSTITNKDGSTTETTSTVEPATITHTLSTTSNNIKIVNSSSLDGLELNVINSKATILPSTGGIGTTIFTIVGIALMALAVIAIVIINRKKNK